MDNRTEPLSEFCELRSSSRTILRHVTPVALAALAIDGSARELTLLRERTETEPRLHGRREMAVTRQHHPLACDGSAYGIQPQPDRCHAAQICGNIQIDVESRIDPA